MFNCCRCNNSSSKKDNKNKKNKKSNENDDEQQQQQNNEDKNDENKVKVEIDHSKDVIEIRLKSDNETKSEEENEIANNTNNEKRQVNNEKNNDDNDKSENTSSEKNKVNNENVTNNIKTTITTSNITITTATTTCTKTISNTNNIYNNKSDIINHLNINLVNNDDHNEEIDINNVSNKINNTTNDLNIINNIKINNDVPINKKNNIKTTTTNINKIQSSLYNKIYDHNDNNNDDDDDDDDDDTIIINNKKIRKASKDTILSSGDITVQYDNDIEITKSCMSRRSSSKSSIRKKVNINDSTEVIPSSELASIDDDEVFSDSVPPKIPRGDMCAPYIATKRGSFQGYFGYLPDWFNEDRFYTTNEQGGILEPPVTPVGRDELALKRHRLYSELLLAAQAAVEHRVRFDPFGPDIALPEDCDPDLKPSVAAELEKQVDRLEKLVERLERSVSAHQLEIANKVFNSVTVKNTQKRRSFDIETAELPPIPNTSTDTSLDKRIDRLENNINKINYIKEDNKNNLNNNNNNDIEDGEGSLENIPTVLDEYLIEEGIVDINQQQEQQNNQSVDIKQDSNNMSVNGYEDIILGPLTQYLNVSNKIGGDVAKHALLVGKAFDAQFAYIKLATQVAQPQQNKQMELLKPTSDQIAAIQEFREKNRTSQFFNHLSAISESIPALGWVCVAPTPGPHVKEMNDAGQFYTNRVLKDWKDKNPIHGEWARSWVQTLTELQKYIKQYHTTGLVWSGKGQAPAGIPPPPPGCPPPPPPPVLDMSGMSLGDDRSALFAEINRGEDVTKGLRKVTSEMQTHKNPTLRTGPAPFKAPTGTTPTTQAPAPVTKTPVFQKDGKKWIIEYQKSNPNLNIDNVEMNNVIYMFRCENSTLTIKGKVNSVFLDSCKKCSLLVDSVVASIEFVNCQSVQMQVLQKCPTISIDKTDGCQMYLSKESLGVEIVSSKSSEMNVMIPKGNGDYVEQPIPEQYKTLIKGTSLQTTCVESLG